MSVSTKIATKSAVALAVAGGLLAGGLVLAGGAQAAAPTFEPDPNSAGSVALYDASGVQVTSGSTTAHPFATYYAASGGAIPGSNGGAQAYAATPQDGVNSNNWSNDSLSASTQFGPSFSANYPGPLKNSPNAIAKATPDDFSLDDYIGEYPAASTKDPNVYQIRIYTGSPTKYYTMDVKVTGTTWTQVYPAVKTTTSVSTPKATPANPTSGQSTTLTSTVAAQDGSHPAGSVELFDGTTDAGAATFTASTGAISKAVTPAKGAHSYTFVFTPTDTASYSGSTSAALSLSVSDATSQDTTTVVSGPTTGTVGDTVTYVATVKAGGTNVGAGAGTVQFKVDGTNSGSPVAVTNGAASFGYTLSDTAAHTITAAFTHASGQLYNDSADTTGVTVTATAATNQPDPQDVVVNVPAGTLVISTPYTAANPFVLGNLVLNPSGTGYTASANFGDTSATTAAGSADAPATTGKLPAGATAAQVDAAKAAQQGASGNGTGNGITITDTRANSQGWVASAQTTDFTNPSLNTPIDGNNLTFHDLKVKYVAGNAIQSGVAVNNIDTFKTAKKAFATYGTKNTPGTVAIAGVLTLTAPTSTKAGQYTATVTFTIV